MSLRSCNGAIIAGPDQSLPAQIEFSIKHTAVVCYICVVIYLQFKNKHLVYLFKYITGLLTYLTFKKSGKVLQKKIFKKYWIT